MDSCYKKKKLAMQKKVLRICSIISMARKETFFQESWHIVQPTDVLKQNDGSNCGVYAFVNAFLILKEDSVPLAQVSDLELIRLWLAAKIIEFKLIIRRKISYDCAQVKNCFIPLKEVNSNDVIQTFQGDRNGYEQIKKHIQKRRNECIQQTSTESDIDMVDIESDSKTGKGINIEFVTESPLSESGKDNRKHVEKISVNNMNANKNKKSSKAKFSKLDKNLRSRPLEVKSKNVPLKISINDVTEDEQQSIKEEEETSELSEESDNGSLSEYTSSNESVLESIYKSSPFKDFVRNHFDFVKKLVSRNNQMITEYKRSERIAASNCENN